MAPCTAADAKGLLKAAIRDDDPVLFIEHSTLYQTKGEVPDDEDFLVPIGVSDVKRERRCHHRLLLQGLQISLEAAEKLAEKASTPRSSICGRCARWTLRAPSSSRSRRPTAWSSCVEGLACIRHRRVSSRVTELAFDYLDAPVRRVARAEVPLPYNRRLEQMALPQTQDVINAVKDVMYLK